jgi:hypothetical protein
MYSLCYSYLIFYSHESLIFARREILYIHPTRTSILSFSIILTEAIFLHQTDFRNVTVLALFPRS